jgi:molecular chaperone DnaK
MEQASKRIFEFLPLSIRLETQGEIATPLVLRGTPLPAKRSETFSTAADAQVSVETELFLGESSLS